MRCPNCLQIIDNGMIRCTACGFELNKGQSDLYYLPYNTRLHDRYILGRVIGSGGFGLVYKAWDEKLERIVAVKEYFPTIYLNRDSGTREVRLFDEKKRPAFERGRAEFLEEARKIAKYNTHPNIVHVYDYFEENGTTYFVMEYLDGHSLRDYVKLANANGKVFTVRSAVHVTMKVLNALKATHADGIIHRDIKPNNIYILKDGTVKLFDFGAARLSDTETEKTRTVILTKGYAPVEQYQKKSKQGPYTDIYSVGAVLYEMLTGVRPEESINRKVEDHLKTPSSINGKVPEELDNIVMRAMAVQADIRFKTTDEFYKALDSGRKIRNAEKEILRRKHRRNRIILLMFLFLALVGGYVGYNIYQDYREVVLEDSVIDLWVTELNGDEGYTKELYKKISEEFAANNPQITVEYTVIPEEQYASKLTAALDEGNGPDLFINPGKDVVKASELADIGLVYEDVSFNAEDYYFLAEHRQDFCDRGVFPLLIDVDVLYQNIMKEGLPTSRDYADFKAGKANYSGTLMENTAIQNEMAGMYEIVTDPKSKVYGHFLYEFSINNASDETEKKAAARLLYYFLSDNSQEYLSIEAERGIPVNKNVWDVFMQVNYDYSFLEGVKDDIVFED